MGELADKVSGFTNETIGEAKRAIGAEIDNPKLVAEGDLLEAKGDLQKGVGAVNGVLGDKI